MVAAFLNVTSVWLHTETSVMGPKPAVCTGACNRISCPPRAAGERYRREMLAHGGGKEPMLMVQGKQSNECELSCDPLFF